MYDISSLRVNIQTYFRDNIVIYFIHREREGVLGNCGGFELQALGQ